jgi:exosortase H (IPTLxxWG-CTERM-specific)
MLSPATAVLLDVRGLYAPFNTPPDMRARVLFAVRFLVLLIAFYLIAAVKPVHERVVVPYTNTITSLSAVILQAFRFDVVAAGTVMTSRTFAMDVSNGCNAVETMIFFAAAVMAFPAPYRERLLALFAGLLAIQFLNLLRLASLFWLGDRHPHSFDLFHVAVWQVVMILAGVTMFAMWSSRRAAEQRS